MTIEETGTAYTSKMLAALRESIADGYRRAYLHLVWLEQQGFENPSVELMGDGSGMFLIPLSAGPRDYGVLLDQFAKRVGPGQFGSQNGLIFYKFSDLRPRLDIAEHTS